ncbi:MAG: divergent PAP2 family protein [Clostridia bacterium]|nr:divergent PAP2 family protein [Clostridia bacterium]
MGGLRDILNNQILVAGAIAWVLSQITKTVIHLILNKKLVLERMFGDGGMPSSHSATVTAVAVTTGMTCGWDSPVFAVAAILALVVMHDAMGVRQETGKQAKVINSMVDLLNSMSSGELTPEETLKEFVGHTRRQVYVGAVFGAVVALLVNALQ